MEFEWTKEKPTEPGFYWRRFPTKGFYDDIVKVRLYCGKLCVSNWELGDGGFWAGPIPAPKLLES